MSELSDITVGSSVAGLAPLNRYVMNGFSSSNREYFVLRRFCCRISKVSGSYVNTIPEASHPRIGENSSDSISVDSSEDEHILNEVSFKENLI